MFTWKIKPKPFIEEVPGEYHMKIVREYRSDHTHVVDKIPEKLFSDIDTWCLEMGLVPLSPQVAKFNPINMMSGDSIQFTLDIKFSCGKAAMLFKLAHGGYGQMGMNVQACI